MTKYLPFIVIGVVIVIYLLIVRLFPSIRKPFDAADAYSRMLLEELKYELVRGAFTEKRCQSVRSHRDCRIQYFHEITTGYHVAKSKYYFFSQMDVPEQVQLRLAEKNASQLRGSSTKLVDGISQNNKALLKRSHLNDAELQQRFDLFTEQPAKANRLLADARLKQLLLRFTHVDLRVADRLVFFADWGGREWIARCGGKMRAAKESNSPRGLEIMRAYHNDVAELICTVVHLVT